MSTVDEILATERYTDRRGTLWQTAGVGRGVYWFKGGWSIRLTEARMRLLIEREQHRDVCLGMWECHDHPAPRVAVIESDYGSFAPNSRIYDQHDTLAEAMDAARALAVKP